MHSLVLLLLAALTACAVPRPHGLTAGPSEPQLSREMGHPELPFLTGYRVPRLMMQNPILTYDDRTRAIVPPVTLKHDWLNKEIDRINRMERSDSLTPYEVEFSSWIPRNTNIGRPYKPINAGKPVHVSETIALAQKQMRPLPLRKSIPVPPPAMAPVFHKMPTSTPVLVNTMESEEKKKAFALTPFDVEYYDMKDKIVTTQKSDGHHEGGEAEISDVDNPTVLQPPRQTRQNPNLGRSKNLVAENLNRLKIGLTQENGDGTDKPLNNHVSDPTADPANSIYSTALIAAVGTAVTIAVIGFAFGWYTLSKKAKAAADVDYPAYGVTGPTVDTSGDRKLAHSAHMYHYQHQKQQIIAMERNGMDHRNGSVSDPESEEENEEGDYTVYECPGFATTGDMEVKNPLFSENPTPATPGKCELVKPQPKE